MAVEMPTERINLAATQAEVHPQPDPETAEGVILVDARAGRAFLSHAGVAVLARLCGYVVGDPDEDSRLYSAAHRAGLSVVVTPNSRVCPPGSLVINEADVDATGREGWDPEDPVEGDPVTAEAATIQAVIAWGGCESLATLGPRPLLAACPALNKYAPPPAEEDEGDGGGREDPEDPEDGELGRGR